MNNTWSCRRAKTRRVWSAMLLQSFLVLFLLSVSAGAKTSITELKTKLQLAENEFDKKKAYDSIFAYYQYSNNDSVIYYTKQGLEHFINVRYKEGISDMLSILGGGKESITEIKTNLQLAENEYDKKKAYDRIFTYYQYSNNDSIIYYTKQGLAHFITVQYKEGISDMLSILGGIYSSEGMLDVAKQMEEEALNIFTELIDTRGIAECNNGLGVIEGRKGHYGSAVNHFLVSLEIYKNTKDTIGIADTYIKLGTANEKGKNYYLALEYYNTGLSYYTGKPVNDVVIFLDNNIGNVYLDMNDTINAIKYYTKALDESKDSAYEQIHMLPLENMGNLYGIMGDTVKALEFTQKALEIAKKEHLGEDQTSVLISIANLYLKSDPKKAMESLNDALLIAQKTGVKSLETNVLSSIIEIYRQKGDYKEAFSLQERQKILSDSILIEEQARANSNLEAMFELDKKTSKVHELEFNEQKQKQKRDAILVIAITLMLFLLLIINIYMKTRKLNAELNIQKGRLEKASAVKNKLISIIAHDLLGTIGFMPLSLGLCRDKTIPETEKDQLLSQVELNAVSSYETLQNMLDWGKAQIQGIIMNQSDFNALNIAQEVLKFINVTASNKQVTIKNSIPSDLMVYADVNHFKFILRNLLTNALKYSNKLGEIIIDAKKDDNTSMILFSVKDNGIGIAGEVKAVIFDANIQSAKGTDNETGNGIGLNLCKEFVMENGGRIWVESEKGAGSIFYFTLKSGRLV